VLVASAIRNPQSPIRHLWWSRAFAAASIAWAIALALAPFAASRPDGGGVVYGFAYSVYAIGRVICHQIPARSFQLWTVPMPVCARCTGIYLGAALTAVILLALDVRLKPSLDVARDRPELVEGPNATKRPSPTRPGPRNARALLVAAAIPTAATLVYEWITGDTPANGLRALAGVPIGAAVAWIIREVN
jgi:hypothetical protein